MQKSRTSFPRVTLAATYINSIYNNQHSLNIEHWKWWIRLKMYQSHNIHMYIKSQNLNLICVNQISFCIHANSLYPDTLYRAVNSINSGLATFNPNVKLHFILQMYS